MYLLPVYLLPVKCLVIYLLIYLHLMAYGHTHPLFPTLLEFCPSHNAKTAWSVCNDIIMYYAVPTSFKHHPIPDGLIAVSESRFSKKIYTTRKIFLNIVANRDCVKVRFAVQRDNKQGIMAVERQNERCGAAAWRISM